MTDVEFIVLGILAEAGDIAGSRLRAQVLGRPGTGSIFMYGLRLQGAAGEIRSAMHLEGHARLRRRGWASWRERAL